MEKIKLIIGAQVPHLCQIITGFLMLKKQGYDIEFEVLTDEEYIAHNRLAFLLQGKELPKEFAFDDDHPTEKGGE